MSALRPGHSLVLACFLFLLALHGVQANTEIVQFIPGALVNARRSDGLAAAEHVRGYPMVDGETVALEVKGGKAHQEREALQAEGLEGGNKRSGRWYAVYGLDKDTAYECRISYPASTPTDFTIRIFPQSTMPTGLLSRWVESFENETPSVWVHVHARHTGVSPSGAVDGKEVLFNLAIERLIAPGIPTMAVSLALLLLPLVLYMMFWGVPLMQRVIRGMSQKREHTE